MKKLLTFHYIGINKASQKINGDIEARSLVLAKIELRRQGIIISKIVPKNTFFFKQKRKKIKSSDITVFSRQLATMTESGIPLIQSFDIIAKGQYKKRFKELIENIKYNVETGLTLSEALKKHPAYFNELFCNLVEAGEKSGSLDIMLEKIATYKEKIESIKKRIKKALVYPLAVVVIAFIVTAGLLIFVVPQFEALFKSFGADLPAMTKTLIDISNFVQSYWYLVLGSLVGTVYAFIHAVKHSSKFAHYVDKILLKIPIIAPILEKAAIARFSRTLSITFAAGLTLVEALKLVAGTTGNIIFSKATHKIKEEISTGLQINKAMQNTQLFPNMVIQMVAIGEESGTLEKMLSKIAGSYEEDVDNAVDSLSNLLEPVIMAILGILVGGLLVSMYLPIFKLGSAL